MTSGRDEILAKIRDQLNGVHDPESRKKNVEARLQEESQNFIPQQGKAKDQRAQFISFAKAADANVTHIQSIADLAKNISKLLRQNNYEMAIRIGNDELLNSIDWGATELLLDIRRGASDGQDQVTVSRAFAAVAETGTLAFASGPENPATLALLGEMHIAVVKASDMVRSYEDVWQKLRAENLENIMPSNLENIMPRKVDFITGPSRSADIEQTLQLGAHGPKHLEIVILDNA